MAENREGNLCPNCEQLNQIFHLKFMYISLTEMVLKCENPICMYPFRNFQYKNMDSKNSTITENIDEIVNVYQSPVKPHVEKLVTSKINQEKLEKNTKPKTNLVKIRPSNITTTPQSASPISISHYLESMKAKQKRTKSSSKNKITVKQEKNQKIPKLCNSLLAERIKKGVFRPLDILTAIQRL